MRNFKLICTDDCILRIRVRSENILNLVFIIFPLFRLMFLIFIKIKLTNLKLLVSISRYLDNVRKRVKVLDEMEVRKGIVER